MEFCCFVIGCLNLHQVIYIYKIQWSSVWDVSSLHDLSIVSIIKFTGLKHVKKKVNWMEQNEKEIPQKFWKIKSKSAWCRFLPFPGIPLHFSSFFFFGSQYFTSGVPDRKAMTMWLQRPCMLYTSHLKEWRCFFSPGDEIESSSRHFAIVLFWRNLAAFQLKSTLFV